MVQTHYEFCGSLACDEPSGEVREDRIKGRPFAKQGQCCFCSHQLYDLQWFLGAKAAG